MEINTAKNDHNGDFIKLIALITMIIDHIGACLLPEIIGLRIIGRIAFPIFAYSCAMGAKYTSNFKNYMLRLVLFALISEPIYRVVLGRKYNAIAVIVYGALAVYFLNKKVIGFRVMGVIMVVASFFIRDLSYGGYGIFMIVIFYFFEQKAMYIISLFLLINIGYAYFYKNLGQFFSVMALPFILIKNTRFNLKLPKYMFYVFYPLHLLIILIIKRTLGT